MVLHQTCAFWRGILAPAVGIISGQALKACVEVILRSHQGQEDHPKKHVEDIDKMVSTDPSCNTDQGV